MRSQYGRARPTPLSVVSARRLYLRDSPTPSHVELERAICDLAASRSVPEVARLLGIPEPRVERALRAAGVGPSVLRPGTRWASAPGRSGLCLWLADRPWSRAGRPAPSLVRCWHPCGRGEEVLELGEGCAACDPLPLACLLPPPGLAVLEGLGAREPGTWVSPAALVEEEPPGPGMPPWLAVALLSVAVGRRSAVGCSALLSLARRGVLDPLAWENTAREVGVCPRAIRALHFLIGLHEIDPGCVPEPWDMQAAPYGGPRARDAVDLLVRGDQARPAQEGELVRVYTWAGDVRGATGRWPLPAAQKK